MFIYYEQLFHHSMYVGSSNSIASNRPVNTLLGVIGPLFALSLVSFSLLLILLVNLLVLVIS